MKALSLWQPWASLIMAGAKRFETRSWATSYRGPLLIHAAKTWNDELSSLCVREPFKDALECVGIFHDNPFVKPRGLPFGALLGTVELVDCHPVERVVFTMASHDPAFTNGQPAAWPRERAFGDYTPGRLAWELRNPKPFPSPIPFVGRQGLFNVPDTVIEGLTP